MFQNFRNQWKSPMVRREGKGGLFSHGTKPFLIEKHSRKYLPETSCLIWT